MSWVPSAVDKDEEEEDMQALTELQTPDVPESEDPDVVETEYDVRYGQVLSAVDSKATPDPRTGSAASLGSLCDRSRT